MSRKRLGQILVERGVIELWQLAEAIEEQRHSGERLGAILVSRGFSTESDLCKALGEALKTEVVDLSHVQPDHDALHVLRPTFCEAHELIPITLATERGRKVLGLAMADPLNMTAIEEIEFTHGVRVKAVLAGRSQVREAIGRHYYRQAPPKIGPEGRERMVLVRRGGTETVEIDYDGLDAEAAKVAAAAAAASQPLPITVDSGPLHASGDSEPIALTEEVTNRTALVEIILEHEARRKAGKDASIEKDLNFLFGVQEATPEERLERMERRFWALLRVLARRGLLDRDEFLREFDE